MANSFVDRFMRATGRLRAVFGPADRSSTEGELSEESKTILAQREAEAQRWQRVTRPDGSTYIVPRDPGADDRC